MRVLQLGKYYEPYVGGIETHLGLLADGLHARGVNVEVLVHGEGVRTTRERVRGIPVTRVGAIGRLMSTEISPRLIGEIERKYDLLHLHTPHPMGMAAYLAARKPPHALVVTHHSDVVRQVRLKRLLHPLFRGVLSRADAIVATSQRYLESSDELGPYKNKVNIIPYGIDLQQFSPALRESPGAVALRQRYGDRLILSAGRLIYYKGFEVLIDAMQRIEGHLLLVGDGPLRAALGERVRRNGVQDRVTLIGPVPNSGMGSFYGAADVFVLPSIARSEAFGIVQIEALAAGLPVVNTSIDSGVPEVSVDELTGLTVQPNDSNALARAVMRVLDDPALASRFGTAGRKRAVDAFTAERMLQQTMALYSQVLTAGAGRAPRAGVA